MNRIVMDFGFTSVRTAYLCDGELVELMVDKYNRQSLVGNIYAAKVENIVLGQFAFLSIGEEKNGFLQLDDKKQEHHLKGRKLKNGDQIIVQVLKDGEEEKGPALSAEISLTGRYAVVIFGDTGHRISISSKISDSAERKRLEKLVSPILPEGFSVIMRTNSSEAGKDALQQEIQALSEELAGIMVQGQYQNAPACLRRQGQVYTRTLKTFLDCGADSLALNSARHLDEVTKECIQYMDVSNIMLQGPSQGDIFDAYFITPQMEKAFHKKLWLKSGGFIIIEETAAATVVDVNTGKAVKKKNKEGAVLRTNIEAAAEIARQLRLRNISGIVIVDFVDMKLAGNKDQLLFHLEKALAKDRVPVSLVSFSSLSLVELTRKHTRPSLTGLVKTGCRACHGTGMVFDGEYIGEKALRAIEAILRETVYDHIVLESAGEVLKAVKLSGGIGYLEAAFNAKIKCKEIETGEYGYFGITKGRRETDHGKGSGGAGGRL